MATIAETLFPSTKNQTAGSLVGSAVSTPQVAPTATKTDLAAAATPTIDAGIASTPPPFTADVPSTMDATNVATAVSEPVTLPQIPEQKVFQMADGRYYSPATGVSANTREEAMGIAPATSGPSQPAPQAEAPAPSGQPAQDDVTLTIQTLFPESDSLVKQYQDLRKSSGVIDVENQLNDVNKQIADLNAVIQNIESDVRAQAGGMADASFVAATIADRMRRLAPLANQLNARQQALSSSLQVKKDAITEQLGLSKADMAQANADREYVRKGVSDLLETFGADAFKNASPELLSEIERRAGFPPGVLASRVQTLKQQEALRSGRLEEEKMALEKQKLEQMTPAEKYGTGIIGEYQFYAEQESAAGRQPLSFDEYQNRDANRKARLSAAVSSGGLSTAQFNRLNTISDNARQDQNIKEFTAVRSGYEAARGAAASKSSLGDIIMMRMVAKITDPSTGVREEEYRTFSGAIGTLARYGVALTKDMVGKGKLTDKGREALLSEIQKIYNQRKGAYQNAIDAYTKQAEKAGGTAEDILPAYVAPEDAAPQGEIIQKGNAQYRKNPDGSYTRIK